MKSYQEYKNLILNADTAENFFKTLKENEYQTVINIACALGRLELVKILLKEKVSLYTVDGHGLTPAISALLISGNPKLMKLVMHQLTNHAELSSDNLILKKTQEKINQITKFIQDKKIDLKENETLLKNLSFGILKNLPDDEISALMQSIQELDNLPILQNAESRFYDHVEFMLDHGINVDTCDGDKNLLYFWIINMFDDKFLDIILKFKPTKIINQKCEFLVFEKYYFFTPLALTLLYAKSAACNKLLDNGANPDVLGILYIDNNKQLLMKLPLVLAYMLVVGDFDQVVSNDLYNFFEKILKTGFSLKTWMDNTKFTYSLTDEIVIRDKFKLFELMLKYGVKKADDFIQLNFNQWKIGNDNNKVVEIILRTPLHFTIINPKLTTYLDYLLSEKLENADIDVLDCYGQSPLETACCFKNASAVEKLLNYGASPYKYCEEYNGNILAIPCQFGLLEIVKLIVEKHPLSILDLSKKALEKNPNIYIQCSNDKAMRKFIKFYNDNSKIPTRLRYMRRSNKNNNVVSYPPLFSAFIHRQIAVMEYLLEKGAPYERLFSQTKRDKEIFVQLAFAIIDANINDFADSINLLINKFKQDHHRYKVTFVNKLSKKLLNGWKFDIHEPTLKEKIEKSKLEQQNLLVSKRKQSNNKLKHKANTPTFIPYDNSCWEMETCDYSITPEKYFIEEKGISLQEFNRKNEQEALEQQQKIADTTETKVEKKIIDISEITWLNGKISSKMPEVTYIDNAQIQNYYCYIDKINIMKQSKYSEKDLKKYYLAAKDFCMVDKGQTGIKKITKRNLYVKPQVDKVSVFAEKILADYEIKVNDDPRFIGFTVISDKKDYQTTKHLIIFSIFENNSHKKKLLQGAYKNGKITNVHLPVLKEDDNSVTKKTNQIEAEQASEDIMSTHYVKNS